MTAIDDKLEPKVLAMIRRVGVTLSISQTTGGSFDPATNSMSGTSTQVYSITGTPWIDYELRYIDGDVVRLGDARVFIAGTETSTPSGYTPAENDAITFDSEQRNVVSVKEYGLERVAAYELQVRRIGA